ncbi:MAG TPA: tRNA pseudouridine(13) synthase TruD [Anaerolineae bacterium]|nr:tRNA pseudouridine(13) synthase TruD [Anaerolineae bacterium]
MTAERPRFKVQPDDFVVEEQARLPLAPTGAYTLYRVRKRGLTTLEVGARMAAMLGLRSSDVLFPALKDKDAVVLQYASVKGHGPSHLEGTGFSAERVGRSTRPLRPGDLAGNRFTIVLRDLAPQEIPRLRDRLAQVERYGVPNYFDQQRFGSLAPDGTFIGKQILQQDVEGALRTYLTQPLAGDPPRVRAFKRFAQGHWGDWPTLFQRAPKPSNFRSVLTFLKDHPSDFKRALNLVTPRLLPLFLAAYQSFLWNRIAGRYLRGRLQAHGLPFARIKIAGEDLPIHRELADPPFSALARVSIPLLHHRATFEDPEIAALVEAVLGEEGLALGDLKARVLKRAYLSRGMRALLVIPREIAVLGTDEDDLFPGRRRLTLTFVLPPGSYATLVLKGLMV